MYRRMTASAGAVGLAVATIVLGASGAAANPPTPNAGCRAVPGVTVSGDNIIFSGFAECGGHISSGRIFVLAYVGPPEVQKFVERSEARCPLDESRCDGKIVSLPNPPGPQTFCSFVESHIGHTANTVDIDREKTCFER
jgi:hypothetical protein